ncbi:MAG: hypothetical protein IKF11_03480 [Methanobrevibacter sp.]|nr:hypothetical protein [Methanobrevibacter sp.]
MQQFRIHYQSKNNISENYPHMGVTAREGIHVLYRIEGTTQWFNVDAYTSRNSPMNVNMKFLAQNGQPYEILIYGPVFSEIETLKIEIEDGSEITALNNDISNDILIVGGIHSSGVGCTASGVMFSNILARKFDKHFRNISFNETNHLKTINKELKNYDLDKYDTIILELDYIRQDAAVFDSNAKKVIRKLKSKCNNLICWYTIPKSEEKYSKLTKFAQRYSNKRNISVLDLSFIYDEELSEMCTHSKNFINDTGNIMIYKRLLEQINKNSEEPVESNFNEKLRGLKNGIFKFNR